MLCFCSEPDSPTTSAQSENVEEVYFQRLDMRLDTTGAAELLNEYYDELNDTVTNMKDMQGKYEKLNNLNKCNMNMMRREMTNWTDYYKLQIEQTNLLAATREAELKEARKNLKKTHAENKQLRETNSKLEAAIQNERMKLKNYIQQNIKERVKQMTHSITLPEEHSSGGKNKPNPSEYFLKSKGGASNSICNLGRKVEKSVSPVERKSVKPNSHSFDAKHSDMKPATTTQRPPNKKPKVFLAHNQAWDNSTAIASDKYSSKYTVKKMNPGTFPEQSPVLSKQVAEPRNPEQKKHPQHMLNNLKSLLQRMAK